MEINDIGYFPLAYYEDFLKFIHDNREHIEVITYDDLIWGDDYDYENNYPTEKRNWDMSMSNGLRDQNKIYVLIQHDVDAQPHRTSAALELEKKFNIKSCNMLFNKRVNRRHLQSTGELIFDEDGYDINHIEWKKYEDLGFNFCYHANSFEQSDFDITRSMETFEKDVCALRKFFDIKYFSPHGGARSSEGKSNNSLPIPDSLTESIRWVANGHTVRFDGVFSDGGPNSKGRDPSTRDLKDFVAKWQKGKRYRVLTHPQYYAKVCGRSERLMEAEWYRKMLDCYYKKGGGYWEGLSLSLTPPVTDKKIIKQSRVKKLVNKLFGKS